MPPELLSVVLFEQLRGAVQIDVGGRTPTAERDQGEVLPRGWLVDQCEIRAQGVLDDCAEGPVTTRRQSSSGLVELFIEGDCRAHTSDHT